MSLIEHLQQIQDFRSKPEYPLWVVLLLVIMGTMSGYTGYRPLAEFVTRHQVELLDLLELPYERLPSLSTIRRIMVRVNFNSFSAVFNAWVQADFGSLVHHQIATDGKGIKVSVRDYDQSFQDFIALVSAFSVTQGVVMGLEPMRNQQTSEIRTVECLLDKLHLPGVCFSLDALHTQKKR
jgi:DDE_Tnp_1-associated